MDAVFNEAQQAQAHAYAPYSKFLVSAAFAIKGSSEIVVGANIENASFGATVCAERVALWSAIGTHGKREFEFMVLVTDTNPAAAPCGICLQVLSEFCDPEFPIFLANTKGVQEEVKLGDLMTRPFDKASL